MVAEPLDLVLAQCCIREGLTSAHRDPIVRVRAPSGDATGARVAVVRAPGAEVTGEAGVRDGQVVVVGKVVEADDVGDVVDVVLERERRRLV